VDLLDVLLLVAVQPGTVPDLEAILAGVLRHRLEILADRICAHRADLALQTFQIFIDLARRGKGAAERTLAWPIRREGHALQRLVSPAGDLYRPIWPPP